MATPTKRATERLEGFNVNYPLPRDTSFADWQACLQDACERIRRFAPNYLVVSLGVDTFVNDPISFFKLTTPDYVETGAAIGALGLPTLFVMEGGYDVAEVGQNVVSVLRGASS